MSFKWPSSFFRPEQNALLASTKTPLDPIDRGYSPSSFIDDIAIESQDEGDPNQDEGDTSSLDGAVLSEQESDIAFINDSSDLSVYDTSEDESKMPDNSILDESELSDLPVEVVERSPSKKKNSKPLNSSSDDVTIVPTPTKRKATRRRTRAVHDMDTDEENETIVKGDSMFSKGSSVKASTRPPPVSTRKTSRSSSSTLSATSTRGPDPVGQENAGKEDVVADNISPSIVNTNGASGTTTGPPTDIVPPGSTVSVNGASSPSQSIEQPPPSAAGFRLEMQKLRTYRLVSYPLKFCSYVRDLMKDQMQDVTRSILGAVLPAIREEMAVNKPSVAASTDLVPATPKTPEPVPATVNNQSPNTVLDVSVQAPFTPVRTRDSVAGSVVVARTQPPSEYPRPTQSATARLCPLVFLPAEHVGDTLLPAFQSPTPQQSMFLSLTRPGGSQAIEGSFGLGQSTISPHDAAKRLDFKHVGSLGSGDEVARVSDASTLNTSSVDEAGPQAPINSSNVDDQTRYNLERLFAASGKRKQVDDTSVSDPSATSSQAVENDDNGPSSKKPKVLDDLTWHHVNYTPPLQCEVADEELQDPAIKHLFDNLAALPYAVASAKLGAPVSSYSRGDKSVIASYTPPSESNDTRRGGRVSFSQWASNLKQFAVITLINAISFVQSGRFINGSRVSPAVVTMRPVNARADSPVNSYRSGITRASSVAGNRYRKSLNIVLHNQDWERLEAWTCVCFNEDVLYCQMTGKSLVLTTRMSSGDETKEAAASSRGANQSMFKWVESPKKVTSPKKAAPASTFTNVAMTLGPNDNIPVYDARDREFDFVEGLANLEQNLPAWKGGEVPVGAFIVAGYSMHSYMGKAQGVESKVLHVSNNLLWVIVCGVPLSQ
ncbi:hypothetical protein R3P38DRAFT_3199966 [Favolaschia claudopus]|uniref:Uncharacterized protein n=1 Tax=Favolaschia claudopus TaxID=2862362 RepID=A0AAW0AZ53_9AGAR